MDIQRPATNKKRNQRIAVIAAVVVGFTLLTGLAFSVAQRPPGVDRDLVYDGAVRRGEFVHEVTAAGSLYAPEIRSVTNQSEGVVERILVLPGRVVGPDDILMELSSPTLLQELADAEAEFEAAEADEFLRRSEAKDSYLNLESSLADATATYETAQLEADAEQTLYAEGASSDLELARRQNAADQQRRRRDIAQLQFDAYPERSAARDEAAQSKLDQQRRKVERLEEKIENLEVRAGFAGVVQEISVEEGQRLSAGGEVARIVNPNLLIARVRVSERDAALIEAGQSVRLEMGRESIMGEVMRIDPAVVERLVTVDVALTGKPTRQLMPDLTVTARIEIEREPETLVVDRPAGHRDDQTEIQLFRLTPDGGRAELVTVELGRVSAREVEVLNGLAAGDQVILADMTEWLEEPVIRIR